MATGAGNKPENFMENNSCWYLVTGLIVTGILFGHVAGMPGTGAALAGEPVLLWSVPMNCDDYCDTWSGAYTSISHDGEQVALGYGPGIIEIRDRRGGITGRWQADRRYFTVRSVEISRDGSSVVAVLKDETQQYRATVVYLDNRGRLLWKKSLAHPSGFAGVSDDGSIVAVADVDWLSFYDRAGNRTGTTVLEGSMWNMNVAGDGAYAVGGVTPRDYSGNLYVIGSNGTTEWFSTTPRPIHAVAISGNGEYLAGAGSGQLRFFARNGSRIWKFNTSTEMTSLAISYNGEYTAAGAQYYLRYFDRQGRMLWQYQDPVSPMIQGAYFTNIAMTDNGEYLATTTRDNATLIFNREGTMVGNISSSEWVWSMSMSGSGTSLAIGTSREIRYYDTGLPAQPDLKVVPVATQPVPE